MNDYKSLKNKKLNHGTQAGFTLIELMIIIGIIGILASMAMTSYKDYLVRSKVSGGIALAASAKSGVGEYYATRGVMPETNGEAGLAAANTITNDYVDSVTIGTVPATGTITITYKEIGGVNAGDTILLSPRLTGGSVAWTCLSNTMASAFLPSSCR